LAGEFIIGRHRMDTLTLDDLFRVTKEVAVGAKKITVHALSDPERNERYKQAVVFRAQLLKKLRDQESPEHEMCFAEIPTLEVQKNVIVSSRTKFMWREANDKYVPEYIPEPDKATAAESAEVILKREKEVKKTDAQKLKYVEKSITDLKTELDKMAEPELKARFVQAGEELTLASAFNQEFDDQTVYLSTGNYFGTIENVRLLPAQVKVKLLSSIREVDEIDPLSLSGPSATD
jgi:hypothetical protein